MNAGNTAKAYRKWLFGLELLKTKEFQDGIKYELRTSPTEGRVVIRFEDGNYDSSILESEYGTKNTENMIANIGFLTEHCAC